jgi:hypothetical protein
VNVGESLVKNPQAAKRPHNRFPGGVSPQSRPRQNPDDRCARWNTKKNSISVKQPNASMNDEKSATGASTPRRILTTLETNAHSKRAVIKTVPTRVRRTFEGYVGV